MNKGMISKVIDVIIELINYIVISFALVSVAMSLREQWIFILFFASNVWITTKFGERLKEIIDKRIIVEMIQWGSVILFIALVYFVGYVKGTLVPFSS